VPAANRACNWRKKNWVAKWLNGDGDLAALPPFAQFHQRRLDYFDHHPPGVGKP
jgi:hypothetical protein